MNNDEWASTIDSVIGNYLEDLIRNHATRQTIDISGNQPQTNETAQLQERFANRRYYTMINELVREYNVNFRLYQQNMRELIMHLRDLRPHQPHISPVASTLFSYVVHPQNNSGASTPLNAEQISRAIETIAYNTTLSETRCPISLEDFVPGEQICKIIVCGHIFKRPGLMNWFARNHHCPVCRRDVIERPSSANRNRTTNRNPMTNLFETAFMNELNGIFSNLGNSLPTDLSYNSVD